MKRGLIVQPLAEKDLADATSWYEQQRSGLGSELLDEIREKLAVIAERPESFPVDYRITRRALLKRFPYSIYFIVDDQFIAIVAVLHVSRDKPPLLEERL